MVKARISELEERSIKILQTKMQRENRRKETQEKKQKKGKTQQKSRNCRTISKGII